MRIQNILFLRMDHQESFMQLCRQSLVPTALVPSLSASSRDFL